MQKEGTGTLPPAKARVTGRLRGWIFLYFFWGGRGFDDFVFFCLGGKLGGGDGEGEQMVCLRWC